MASSVILQNVMSKLRHTQLAAAVDLLQTVAALLPTAVVQRMQTAATPCLAASLGQQPTFANDWFRDAQGNK